jgi:collagenase-like PrtC family protease
MHLSIPTNWQDDLLERINISTTEEIYGKLEKDVIGGGRSSILLPSISNSSLAKSVDVYHRHGLKFNYLLNASCCYNIEYTRRGQRKIRKLLDWLANIGVDSVTVSIPYLLEIIKKCYPVFKVCVSTTAGVDSVPRARYWQELGADQITLSFVDVNRNFTLLKRIRKAVTCRLQLIANQQCLYGCPFYKYHNALSSHYSQSNASYRGISVDYCSLSCRYLRLRDPWRLISAGWIRPEDLQHYRQIGIDSIKLVDRAMSTKALARIINAYTLEQYRGNLLDLFTFKINEYLFSSKKYLWRKLKYFAHPFSINLFSLYRHSRFMRENDPSFLDNQKLDGFINFFIAGKCRGDDCGECGYCQNIAGQALYIPQEYRKKMLDAYGKYLGSLVAGDLFYSVKKNL